MTHRPIIACACLMTLALGCSAENAPSSSPGSVESRPGANTDPGAVPGDNGTNPAEEASNRATPEADGAQPSASDDNGNNLAAGESTSTVAEGQSADVSLTPGEAAMGTGAAEAEEGAPEVNAPEVAVEAAACEREFSVPSFEQLAENPALPDPFTFFDGTPVTSQADWVCRQKEIRLFAEEFIYGRKPAPPEQLEASFANGTLSIAASRGGQTMTLDVAIDAPNGAGPFPAVMTVGGGGLVPQGVATINFGQVQNQIAYQLNPGSDGFGRGPAQPQGDFYRLNPGFNDTGSLMAWAWGGSVIVDALEATTGHNIDTTKLSALGCSRNGKASAAIGLFDERFALVAAASPGSGTTSGWRPAQDQLDSGANVQTAGQIYGENTWMGEGFAPFGNNVNRLPIDQHTVLALAWPRPLIMMEGTNDSWNCPSCSYQTLKYTQAIYEALGTADRVGFPQPDHGHCAQQGTFAQEYFTAFVNRFLLGDESVSTAGLFTDGNFNFDADRYQDGPLPELQ